MRTLGIILWFDSIFLNINLWDMFYLTVEQNQYHTVVESKLYFLALTTKDNLSQLV